MLTRFLTLILAFLTVAPAVAQEGVTVKVSPQHTSVKPGESSAVAVIFEFENHLHIWTNAPEVPQGIDGLSPIPTVIGLSESAKLPTGVMLDTQRAIWPTPDPIDISVGPMKVKVAVYHERTVVFVPVTIDRSAAMGSVTIPLLISYQACNDSTCFAPTEFEASVTFTIGEQTAPADSDLFAGYVPPPPSVALPAGVPTRGSTVPGITAEPAQSLAPGTADSKGPIVIDLGVLGWKITLDGTVGYGLLFIVAMIGGFILNLTPCVLPVIPLKILGLQSQAGSRSRMLFLGFVMFSGLVFFWLAIGALLALGVLRAISEISAYWQFNLAVAVFMSLMGLGMFGLFTVGLPTWVYNIDVKHDSAKGSFGFGVMSAVLATPCVAPLMGGIAAGSSKLPTAVALLLFVFVGIGMGLPYLVLAAYPRLIAWIPRAGPGSELLKQVLGLLMIAVSLFFLGSALITMVAEYPWLAKQLHWWSVAIAIAIACVWLVLRTFQITPRLLNRAAFTALALLLTASAFLWANSQTALAEKAWTRTQQQNQTNQTPGQLTESIWQPYNSAAVDKAIAEGKVVVLDFTADWCAICKVLEATVLHTEQVEAALMSEGVRSVVVDCTSKRAPGWQRLESLGQKGVPTLAIFGPGFKEPWIRNAYTVGEVIQAIQQAKGAPVPPAISAAINHFQGPSTSLTTR